MSETPVVRRFGAEEWGLYRDLRLRALADAPDAFGSTLAVEQARAESGWASRLADGAVSEWDLPLVAEAGGEPIGLAWGRIERSSPEEARLYQMWVAASHRGMGAGRMLLQAVIEWARSKKAVTLTLGVTLRDSPAMRLYTRAGFVRVGEAQPLRPGSELLGVEMRLRL